MRGRRVAALAPLALVLAGCGAAHQQAKQAAPAPAQPSAKRMTRVEESKLACAAGARRPLGSSRTAYAAIVRRRAVAYPAPGRRPFARFGRLNVNGYPTVFSI